MENRNHFVVRLAELWNLHAHRELLYKQSLTMENLGSLRQICSQGFSSSLLFQKEIQWIYDNIKSALTDGDIHNFSKKENAPIYLLPQDNNPVLTRIIQDQEYKSIKLYKGLLSLKNLTFDTHAIISDHFEKLCDISFNLNKELTKNSPKYFSVKMSV